MFRKAVRGFTLIELMIVVAIIGILASIAIPNFLRYQLRSKSSEAAVNLGAIKTSEIAYYGSHDSFVEAGRNPAVTPDDQRHPFNPALDDGWKDLGWQPEGAVYFVYQIASSASDTFAASALGNLDKDSNVQCWAFIKPGASATAAPAPTECADKSILNQVFKSSPDGFY
jgi:type IV pilus assembly protein PilA